MQIETVQGKCSMVFSPNYKQYVMQKFTKFDTCTDNKYKAFICVTYKFGRQPAYTEWCYILSYVGTKTKDSRKKEQTTCSYKESGKENCQESIQKSSLN